MQVAQKSLAQKTNRLAIFLLIGGLLFRGVIALCFYPTFDEAYYYLYSLHLDWSYFDHPIFVALTTGFGPWVTGVVSQFTIRMGALLTHTGSLLLLYLTSLKLFNPGAALLTLAIATITPIFQIGFGILTLPDSPLILFWSASLYCAADEFCRHKQTQSNPIPYSPFPTPPSYQPSYRLAILGILIGLACLSKYHGFLLGFGLVCFCFASKEHRCALRSPWILVGLGLCLITLSPIWFWNIQHDWVSFRFQSDRAVPKRSYDLLNVAVVVLAASAYMFPTIGFPMWWVSIKQILAAILQKFSRQSSSKIKIQPSQLLILWASLPVILGFTFIGGYQQILPAWTMPGFWGITLLLGQQAAIWEQQSPRKVRRWLFGSGLFISSILLILLLHVSVGIFQKPSQNAILGGFLVPKSDPSTELIDTEQLRQGFIQSPIFNNALKKSSFIFTNRYYLGGPIAMSLKPIANTPITCFDLKNDQRGFAFWSKADEWLGKDALYITTSQFITRKDLMANYRQYFTSIQEIETIPIKRAGAVINTIHIYQAKNLLKPYPRSYGI